MGAIADMIRAGVDPDLVERVAMEMVQSVRLGLPNTAEALEARRASARERAARYRANGGGKIPLELREEVFERDGFACVYCGGEDYLQCDHVVPVSKGGDTSLENLATACRVCNAKKKDRDRKAFARDLRNSMEFPRNSMEQGEQPPSPPPPKNTNQTPSTPSPKPTRRAKARTRIVDDAQPTERQRAYVRKLGLSADVFREEWRKFRTHHIANGSLMADWDAAWEKWCGNIGKYGSRSPPRNNRPTIADRYANLINDEPESDHEQPSYDGPTIDGNLAAIGHDAGGRYEASRASEPLGAEPGWPLAATGYTRAHN